MNMEKRRKPAFLHVNGYVAGWLNSDIDEFLRSLPKNTDSAAFVLITCLDSNADVTGLWHTDRELHAALKDAAIIKKRGLLVPSSLLQKPGVRSLLFHGFDEIWFFPTPEIEPKPEGASIVGPGRIDQKTMEKLGPWMETNGCSLAMGDGAGLNVIAKAFGLSKYVIGQSLFQPEPTPQLNECWVEEETPAPAKPRRRALSHA
jgi:hypothetical protein